MSDLNKNDLTLLLDSYKKQVELNTQVLLQHQNLISRMDSMIEIHKETCQNIVKVAEKVDAQSSGFNKITERLSSDRKESLKEHSELKMKIYVAMGLMGVIVLNLIAIYFK